MDTSMYRAVLEKLPNSMDGFSIRHGMIDLTDNIADAALFDAILEWMVKQQTDTPTHEWKDALHSTMLNRVQIIQSLQRLKRFGITYSATGTQITFHIDLEKLYSILKTIED